LFFSFFFFFSPRGRRYLFSFSLRSLVHPIEFYRVLTWFFFYFNTDTPVDECFLLRPTRNSCFFYYYYFLLCYGESGGGDGVVAPPCDFNDEGRAEGIDGPDVDDDDDDDDEDDDDDAGDDDDDDDDDGGGGCCHRL